MEEPADNAGVVALPPLIYAVPLGVGLLVDRMLLKRPLAPESRLTALGFFIAAASLGISAARELHRAGTSIDVFEPTTALVKSGPYADTRNPLYLGLTFVYVGISLAARSVVPLALLPGVLRVMSVGVIEREERYLLRTFGETYREYMERVPRWL